MITNYSYRNWYTKPTSTGGATLHSKSSDVLATFEDWQVADFVIFLLDSHYETEEKVEKLETDLEHSQDEVKELEEEANEFQERSEQDHRTIVDLENEVDELKTKLFNLSNEQL